MSDIRYITDNEYWRELRMHVENDDLRGGMCVGRDTFMDRYWFVDRYSWTITDPESVEFVTRYAGTHILDPMAGTGWWCKLLHDAGVDTLAYDHSPPDRLDNYYHKSGIVHTTILHGDVAQVTREHGKNRTLLLSWPPYDNSSGARALLSYGGNRVIYIGEDAGGCCGSDMMFDILLRDWEIVDQHAPTRWYGLNDYITVYDRKQ